MSEQWPPDWDDPEPEEGQQDVELPELTSFLASLPSPALPASFEARISGAIAAEAAARATSGQPDAVEDAGQPGDEANRPTASQPITAGADTGSASGKPSRGSTAPPGRIDASGPGGSRPGGRRRRLRLPSMQAASWTLIVCLVLAGFGFLVTRSSGSSSSSEAASSAASSESSPASGVLGPAAAGGGSVKSPDHQAGDEPSAAASGSAQTGFLVYSSRTAYQRSTLAGQVREQVHTFAALTPTTPATGAAGATVPASSSSTADAGQAPTPRLSGCVSAVTDGVTPTLVDEATYDGIPAYVIAGQTEIWVVHRGCSAADTELIARVPLNG